MHLHTPQWYVLKGEQKFGPYSQLELVKMMQDKSVYPFDFVWNPNLDNWRRLADLDFFSESTIQELLKNPEVQSLNVFMKRQNHRAPIKGTVLVHDNQKLYRGQCCEISVGGAGVMVLNSKIVPGQTLNFQFRPAGEIETFNAVGEIVAKKFDPNLKSAEQAVKYGLRFQSLRPDVRHAIDAWTKKGAS